MQEISSNRFAGIIETNDAFINGARGVTRRLGFYTGNGLTVKARLFDTIKPGEEICIFSRKFIFEA